MDFINKGKEPRSIPEKTEGKIKGNESFETQLTSIKPRSLSGRLSSGLCFPMFSALVSLFPFPIFTRKRKEALEIILHIETYFDKDYSF